MHELSTTNENTRIRANGRLVNMGKQWTQIDFRVGLYRWQAYPNIEILFRISWGGSIIEDPTVLAYILESTLMINYDYRDTAYTTLPIEPHTDANYLREPPGMCSPVISLYCFQQTIYKVT